MGRRPSTHVGSNYQGPWFDVEVLLRRLAPDEPDEEKAAALGVTRRTIVRLREKGRLTWAQADVYATHLGCHPSELWPEWDDWMKEAG